MNIQSLYQKLQNILDQLSSGRQRTMLVNNANTEIGTAAVPIQVDIADATGITLDVALSSASDSVQIHGLAGAAQIQVGVDAVGRVSTNPISGQTGVAAGTGVDGVTVQRVTLATNVGLPAGTANIGDVDILTIAAGETHIGATGGNSVISVSSPVMSVAGAYATGDYIGTTTTPQAFTLVTRNPGGTSILKSIIISDKNTTAAVALELWVFSATFVAPTDNAAWSITDAENETCLGVIPISASKWYASALNKQYTDDTLALVIKPAVTSLFYAVVARGTTPAWTSLDLQISLGLLQD